MLRIGLTGGIGSGKSTISRLFKELGINIIDTDEIAHRITLPDGPAYESIVQTFGSEILNTDQTINRAALAKIVFSSKQDKDRLEKILHPLIWLLVEQQVQLIDAAYVIIVVPLLFEGNHRNRFDAIVVADCPESVQIERVLSRDKSRGMDDIKAIMSHQNSRDDRLRQADYIIDNSTSENDLYKQVQHLHETFCKLSA